MEKTMGCGFVEYQIKTTLMQISISEKELRGLMNIIRVELDGNPMTINPQYISNLAMRMTAEQNAIRRLNAQLVILEEIKAEQEKEGEEK